MKPRQLDFRTTSPNETGQGLRGRHRKRPIERRAGIFASSRANPRNGLMAKREKQDDGDRTEVAWPRLC